ncbi:RNA-guided endonuclease TnpB family protein [Geobacillus sp. C56-T2]|uniref:RNA-guided endonuclease InsQ/TnpB family protein n=1 Tax=Geobacillus sp. C56-T2 TaxID=600773 RepID=UPI0011A6D310|nr:RNA-guided endonuclease TnpB family protein [Geobacillus sp. C56-T2]NNV06953.1 transposase [Geobacillus sp. MMMUD3]TWG30870.1 IS605 OrfB family transposase [Geobacillus sp. C56-T2]
MKKITMTVKLPLFRPTHAKQEMYRTMRSEFARLLNRVLDIKRQQPALNAKDIDHLLKKESILPSTTRQEARKLALSRYEEWEMNKTTKSFPRFKEKQTILFNNQNWRLRYDNGRLKLGIPTIEKGILTLEKYVPVQTNDYTEFWVQTLLTGEWDRTSKHYHPSFERIIEIKKGQGQLYEKKKRWYFAFSVTLIMRETEKPVQGKTVGVDRGLKMIAVAGCGQTGEYLIFHGRHLGHIRRNYHRLRRQLQTAKNRKAIKRLGCKERRIVHYWNHVISKRIVQFAEQTGATVIKLERLKGIRQMKRHWKRSDRNIHSWSFFDLEKKIQYKAEQKGLTVEYVDPYKTSQQCFRCGNVKRTNRRGSLFQCSCGYTKQADVNASFVISARPSIAG